MIFQEESLIYLFVKKKLTELKYIGDVEELDIETAKNYADLGNDIYNASLNFLMTYVINMIMMMVKILL